MSTASIATPPNRCLCLWHSHPNSFPSPSAPRFAPESAIAACCVLRTSVWRNPPVGPILFPTTATASGLSLLCSSAPSHSWMCHSASGHLTSCLHQCKEWAWMPPLSQSSGGSFLGAFPSPPLHLLLCLFSPKCATGSCTFSPCPPTAVAAAAAAVLSSFKVVSNCAIRPASSSNRSSVVTVNLQPTTPMMFLTLGHVF